MGYPCYTLGTRSHSLSNVVVTEWPRSSLLLDDAEHDRRLLLLAIFALFVFECPDEVLFRLVIVGGLR